MIKGLISQLTSLKDSVFVHVMDLKLFYYNTFKILIIESTFLNLIMKTEVEKNGRKKCDQKYVRLFLSKRLAVHN
jgi:hypothetical protein